MTINEHEITVTKTELITNDVPETFVNHLEKKYRDLAQREPEFTENITFPEYVLMYKEYLETT